MASACDMIPGAWVPSNYCVSIYASDLSEYVRAIIPFTNGDLALIADGSIVLLFDDDGDNISSSDERVVLASVATNDDLKRLNHGLRYYEGYLYASAATVVYRWPYIVGS